MKKIAIGAGAAVLLLAAFLALSLLRAHWQVRTVDGPLPEGELVITRAAIPNGPVDIRDLNTASQRDPSGTRMAFPMFILEWADDRRFGIDAGMDAASAMAFGRLIELSMGSDPAEPLGDPGEQLGAARSSLAGLAFTHLHTDHTQGIASLCPAGAKGLPVFQTPIQMDVHNYTTAPGAAQIEAAMCAQPQRLVGGPIFEIPGFSGLVAIEAGGHTPGSSVFAATVGDKTWILAGDITNFRDALLEDRGKGWVYSTFITPEAAGRLSELRPWLAALDAEANVGVVVSHDQAALERSGLHSWRIRE